MWKSLLVACSSASTELMQRSFECSGGRVIEFEADLFAKLWDICHVSFHVAKFTWPHPSVRVSLAELGGAEQRQTCCPGHDSALFLGIGLSS